MIREETKTVPSGYMMIVVLLLLQGGALFLLVKAAMAQFPPAVVGCVLLNIVIGIMWAGFFMIHPNESVVLQLFGKYAGTAKEPGLKWANPFFSKKRVSARVRNFESGKLKVNDSQGSPIEIAAVVVWKVFDSAEAVFEVDNYEEFVTIQSESALRNLTTTYPYEANDGEKIALRSHPVEIANSLREEIQERLEQAGVSVIEARISHLAYAPEIANAMLRRQQATAIIAARKQIVAGAVGMAKMALEQLSEEGVVDLDEERKAAMVGNLMTVLCSDEAAQPVLNTGSLY